MIGIQYQGAMELSSLYKVSPMPSSPWQGIAFRHLKSESTRKLALTKVTNRLIYRGTVLPNQLFWNENRGAHILRCEAAQADTSTLSTEIWSEEDIRELKLANEVDEPFSYVGNKFTEDSSLSVEASPDFKAISETEHREDSKINCSDLIVEDQVAGFSSSTYGHVAEDKQKGMFWHIVENDLAFMKNGWNSFKKEGLPSLSKTALKLVTLTLWEDHSLVEVTDTQLPQPYSPGLSGLKLAAADAVAIKAYFQMVLSWIRALNIPLNPSYDPEFIAAYFSRRPHVLLFRVFQILAVFGSAYLHLEFEKLLNTSEWIESNTQKRGAELIKDALISLGPVSIKVGQSLSTRPDLIGMVPAKIFAEMQDNLPPFSTDEAVSVIEEELGAPINTLFSELSDMPVAAASFGQVYKGRTVHGQEVAVKVQRPNVLMSVALDVYILRIALDVVRKVAKRRSDLKLYADELGQGFFGELDYLQEADNALEFKEVHSKLSFIEVPEVLRQLSTRRVLTMEWINGDRPIDLVQFTELPNPEGNPELSSRQLRTKQRLLCMVNKGVEASLVQLFDSGILHADPHPGNMLYTEDGKMVFLDFGLLCRMEREHQLAMMAAVTHIVNADWENFVQDLAAMDVLPPYINRREIADELAQSLGDAVPQEGVPDVKFSRVISRVLAIALRHHFRMPPYFVLVLRSIASLEGLALAVDPDFKVFASSYPFVLQKLLTDTSGPIKNILSTLILNKKKQFRWDRLASFITIAQQHSQKKLALETGKEPSITYNADGKVVNLKMIQLLANLLLSEKGTVFRQLILEADTCDLAHMFNSNKAAPLRRNLATAMANVFYEAGKSSLRKHTGISIQEPVLLDSQNKHKDLISSTDEPFLDDFKALTNCSDSFDISMLENRHMQYLFQTMATRLRRHPLLLAHTGWTSFSILTYSLALAAHRLVVAICFKLLSGKADLSSTSSSYQLIQT